MNSSQTFQVAAAEAATGVITLPFDPRRAFGP